MMFDLSANFAAWLHPPLSATELFGLFSHFLVLSLLAVGGAITTAPEMSRYVVAEQHWLSDAQFTSSIAIAQAAPGPNVLFVAVIGWNVAGPIGALATMTGILLPSTALSLWASRWGTRRRETRGVRAFTIGLTPIVIGLLFSTGWILATPYVGEATHRLGALALIVLTLLAMLLTRLSPMWLIGVGAVVGGSGLV
ncbi:MAG: chromate transporter [Pseudomonadota bacterium]|nr:chromate transporter [Pseudomonadota bacterium]